MGPRLEARPVVLVALLVAGSATAVEVGAERDWGSRHRESGREPVRPLGADCSSTPRWSWEGLAGGTPALVPLSDDDGDGIVGPRDGADVVVVRGPDRLFLAQAAAVLAFDGATGSLLWTWDDHELKPRAVAAGDLDGDGLPELVLAGDDTDLVALHHDGSLFWSVPAPELSQARFVTIADLDQDGVPEILIRNVAIEASGAIRWIGGGGPVVGIYPVAADLVPSSPGLELFVGDTLFDATGAVIWSNPGLVRTGLSAVADLDADGEPEIVVTWSGVVQAVDAAGVLLGAALDVSWTGNSVSAPAVADLDGDGTVEVVVSTKTNVLALEWNGGGFDVAWSAPIDDASGQAGVSTYDFDGDGAAEVLARDEHATFVLDGATGSVLWSAPSTSDTGPEAPVVGRLGLDGGAQIVSVATSVLIDTFTELPGSVNVYDCVSACPPRRVWNQHSYHVTNVEDDGRIPAVEGPSWIDPGGYMLQVAAAGCGCTAAVAAPLADIEACEGEEVVLDASGYSLDGCDGTVDLEWRDDFGVLLGTDPVLRVMPVDTATYTVTLTCSAAAECTASDSATVTVRQRPVLAEARAEDLSDCSLGLLVSWPAATFEDPVAGGVYNVYRSVDPVAPSCADALSRPPVASGLTDTRWVDRTTAAGELHVYVVEAEDASAPSPCMPTGPTLGGAVARACTEPGLVDAGTESFPEGVFAVLRASHEAQEVEMRWPDARALLPGEHFHLLKASGEPTAPFDRVNPEGDLSLSFVETDPSSPRQFFDLRVANACEEESLDEFPPSWP